MTAVDDWGLPTRRKTVRPGRGDSYEGLLHEVAFPAFALRLDNPKVKAALDAPRLTRAIGVVYRPETELQSHYFRSKLPEQFDALIHVDQSTALRPLDPSASWSRPIPAT